MEYLPGLRMCVSALLIPVLIMIPEHTRVRKPFSWVEWSHQRTVFSIFYNTHSLAVIKYSNQDHMAYVNS